MNVDNLDKIEPKIYKEEEFNMMLELIENGLWRNVNLSKALHVAEETIIEWKKRQEAQQAHRRAILRYLKKRTDAEKILKELEMDIVPDTLQITSEQLIIIKETHGSETKPVADKSLG